MLCYLATQRKLPERTQRALALLAADLAPHVDELSQESGLLSSESHIIRFVCFLLALQHLRSALALRPLLEGLEGRLPLHPLGYLLSLARDAGLRRLAHFALVLLASCLQRL